MKKKLYCVFIDFSKAFDNVWRYGLFSKLLKNDINGRCFRLIRNMYQGIKSYISHQGQSSETFSCNIGVRQGENLSPFLFAMYLNDLESFLSTNNCTGLNSLSDLFAEELGVYIRLFVLLYADDTIIITENEEQLHKSLSIFGQYCNVWKLKVNFTKTKIVIFSKRHVNKQYHFSLLGNTIDVVKEYVYLGVLFTNTGRFIKAQKRLCEQASRAMFSIFRKCRSLDIPIDCKLKLFDQLILPILLYGSEVWGFEDCVMLERVQFVHLRYCKYVLKKINTNFYGFG